MWDLLDTYKLLSDEIYELLLSIVQALNAVSCTMQRVNFLMAV